MAPGGTPCANMRLLGGPTCTGHCVLYPLWPPRAQQARDRLLSLGHPRWEQGPDGTRAPPGQPHRGADLQNQRVMGCSPPHGVKGKGHALDLWPRLHQGPMGAAQLDRRLPAPPGPARLLSQSATRLDSWELCFLGPALMVEEMPRPPGPQGVGAGDFSNKWGANLTQSF